MFQGWGLKHGATPSRLGSWSVSPCNSTSKSSMQSLFQLLSCMNLCRCLHSIHECRLLSRSCFDLLYLITLMCCSCLSAYKKPVLQKPLLSGSALSLVVFRIALPRTYGSTQDTATCTYPTPTVNTNNSQTTSTTSPTNRVASGIAGCWVMQCQCQKCHGAQPRCSR